TTDRWAFVHYLGVAMCFLGLLGVAGIYARQVKETGWLGLGGYLLLSLFYALTLAFQFIEAFVSPRLATASPTFVEGLLGSADGARAGLPGLRALGRAARPRRGLRSPHRQPPGQPDRRRLGPPAKARRGAGGHPVARPAHPAPLPEPRTVRTRGGVSSAPRHS